MKDTIFILKTTDLRYYAYILDGEKFQQIAQGYSRFLLTKELKLYKPGWAIVWSARFYVGIPKKIMDPSKMMGYFTQYRA